MSPTSRLLAPGTQDVKHVILFQLAEDASLATWLALLRRFFKLRVL